MLRKLRQVTIGPLLRRCMSATGHSGITTQLQNASPTLPRWTPNQSTLLYRQIQQKVLVGQNNLCPVRPWASPDFPTLVRRPDSLLIKYWWSETPFDRNAQLCLPVHSLETGEFLSQTIEVEHLIFNQPIRRDLVHRVLHWSLMFGKRTTHRTRTPSEVAGSGKKPRPQKGLGVARLGNKRASGRRKGGKIFGHIPKDFTFHMPEKVKIKALICCLSAKLAEGKVRVYENEKLADHKTKSLAVRLPDFGHKETFLFVTPKSTDRNFDLASRNLYRVKRVSPNEVCVRDLLKFDKVLFTVQSLRELTELLLAYLFMLEKPKAVKDKTIENLLNLNYSRKNPDEEVPIFDPNENWEPKFEILRDYYQAYKAHKDAKVRTDQHESSAAPEEK